MKRPSTLTLLLLISASIPIAFLPVWAVLGTISPYLAFAFFLLPLLVFLSLFIFASTRRMLRRARHQIEKAVPTNCIICGEPLPTAPLRQARRVQGPHYETIHPEAWIWSEKWRRRALPVILSTLFVIASIATYALIIRDYLLFIVGFALAWLFILGMSWFRKKEIEEFQNQWKKGMNG